MTYYLGKAGALIALPDPEVGLPMTPERIGGTHQLLSGARVRDTIGRMRTWNLSWTAIDLTTYGTLESFYLGTVGPGPYYFLDPEQRNLLSPNVSSGGDVTGDTTGFTFGSNVTPSVSATAGTVGGPHAIQVVESTAVTAFQDVAFVSTLVPVRGSTAYAHSGTFYLASGSPTHYIDVWWLDSVGSVITTAPTGFVTGPTPAGGTRATGTETSPSNAVSASLRVRTSTANTSGGSVTNYFDGLQFEQASAVSAWVPGPGVPLVTVESLSRSTPLAGICDAQMTLVQVG